MNARLAVPVAARALAVVFALVAPGIARAQTPSFTMVGYAPGAGASRIYGLSADGRSAAGFSAFPTSVSTPYPGFVWSASAGRNDFGLEPGTPLGTWSLGISGDGHTAVGYSWTTQGGATTAFRWSGAGTFQSLGTLGSYPYSQATGANNDGSVVVGTASSAFDLHAFRWTQAGGMQALGPANSEANAISRDGSTIVGETAVTSGAPQAFRWTQAGGLQALPALPGTYSSDARGVRADGRDVVGITSGVGVQYPTLWHDGQAQNLGLPTGWYWANPLAVSDDGQVVVGNYAAPGHTSDAAVWTPTTGFMPLADYLASYGITLPTGLWLEECTGVSADGRTFAGWTGGPAAIGEGFVATVPAPGVLAMPLAWFASFGRRRRNPPATRAIAVGIALLGSGVAQAQTPSFTLVGHAPGADGSRVYGLSADGRSAAGFSAFPTSVSTPAPGFVWSASAGRNDFGLEAGTPLGTWSLGISDDGHTAVGYSWATQGGATTAFRWSGTGTFQSLGTMGWANSRATGASNDGTTVVGYLSTQSGNAQQAFRWTPGTGMQTLGPLFSEANAISRDGSTIVGETAVTSGAPQAFRWTQAGGVQALPPLPGTYYSYARGVSADGRDIVGFTSSTTVDYPTLWHDGQAQNLGLPTGWYWANPLAVSDDGQVVVGNYAAPGHTSDAGVWTPTTGFMPLADYLASYGITLPANIILESCTSVSADGKTFAGWTHGTTAEPGLTQGFVATIPAPGWLATLLGSAVFAARRRRSRSAM